MKQKLDQAGLLLWLTAVVVIILNGRVSADLFPPTIGSQLGLGNLVGLVNQLAGVSESKYDAKEASKDSGLDTVEMIRSRGFIGEAYKTQSTDGAPLSFYHIINPLANLATLNKYPVVIYHGLGGDATMMVSNAGKVVPQKPVLGEPLFGNGQDDALAFMLANNNFDVWVVDARGTNLNNHDASDDINIKKSQKFWNFALDEQVLHDVPTVINFILEQTQSEKVLYVGYSESTFFMFALLSAIPEFADKIAAFAALAPVAYVTSLKGLTVPLMSPYLLVPDDFQGNYIPQPLVDTLGTGVRRFCANRLTSGTICTTFLATVTGRGDTNDNAPLFFATALRTTSIRVLKHFLQLFIQKRFGMYDYGAQINQAKYGQPHPPDYQLSRVRLPTIILVRGGQDFLSTPEDQQLLINQLGTKVYLDLQLPNYNHVDFLIAKDVAEKVNIPILKAFYQILLADGASPLRNQSKPQVKVHQPLRVAYPNKDGSVGAKLPLGNEHLLSNLLEGLEYKKRLGALPIFGTALSGYMGSPGAIDLVQNLGSQADRLGETLSNLPNSALPHLPFG